MQPTEAHLTAVKRVLHYLSGTRDLTLQHRNSEEPLTGYSDADWAGDHYDRHSTSGNVFIFGGGVISWSSKKQAVVALRQSISHVVQRSPNVILADCHYGRQPRSNSTGQIPIAHSRTNHIDICFHFIREAQKMG